MNNRSRIRLLSLRRAKKVRTYSASKRLQTKFTLQSPREARPFVIQGESVFHRENSPIAQDRYIFEPKEKADNFCVRKRMPDFLSGFLETLLKHLLKNFCMCLKSHKESLRLIVL